MKTLTVEAINLDGDRLILARGSDGVGTHHEVIVEVKDGAYMAACETARQILRECLYLGISEPSETVESTTTPEVKPLSTGLVKTFSPRPASDAAPADQAVSVGLIAALRDACEAEGVEYVEPSSNREAIDRIRELREGGYSVEVAHG